MERVVLNALAKCGFTRCHFFCDCWGTRELPREFPSQFTSHRSLITSLTDDAAGLGEALVLASREA